MGLDFKSIHGKGVLYIGEKNLQTYSSYFDIHSCKYFILIIQTIPTFWMEWLDFYEEMSFLFFIDLFFCTLKFNFRFILIFFPSFILDIVADLVPKSNFLAIF